MAATLEAFTFYNKASTRTVYTILKGISETKNCLKYYQSAKHVVLYYRCK